MDPKGPSSDRDEPIDDAALATLVRDLADGWQMPPRRLDEVTWHDRVRRGNRVGLDGVRWGRRVLQATVFAVVATVSLAFAAVWLTAPRGDRGVVGASGSPSPTSSGSATSAPPAATAPAGTPLPQLVRDGDLPTPSSVMVRLETGYHMADLATGTLGPQVMPPYTEAPTKVLSRPGGGWACVCAGLIVNEIDSLIGVRLTLETVDADGVAGTPRLLKEIRGVLDPNEPDAFQTLLVDATVTASPDGRSALIAWDRRDGAAGWEIGVDVLDLASLTVTSSESVTVDAPVSQDGHSRFRIFPRASVAPDGGSILLSSTWFVESGSGPFTSIGTDNWSGMFVDGVIGLGKAGGGLIPAGSSSSTDCADVDNGLINKGSYYGVCRTQAGGLAVRRVGVDGTVFDTTELPGTVGADVMASTARTADAVFVWDPVGHQLSRFDLATGEVTTGRGEASVGTEGPLDGIAALGRGVGRWLAPVAQAKVILRPGMVVSPDGTRVYALGAAGEDGEGGSSGIYAFDATTLASTGHWPARADLGSIAVSADSRFVFAAAKAAVGPDGSGQPGFGASVTVYDGTDGHVDLLAGQLGSGDMWLVEPVLH